MADWDPQKYLQFKQQRTQPSIDLANRVRLCGATSIVDLGCGPGNSTQVLKDTFPHAHIVGVDNSQNMIDDARSNYPDLEFELGDVTDLKGSYDLVFSNACLQWVPKHEELFPQLMEHVNEGGCLAVQMPRNYDEPLYQIMNEVTKDPKWGFAGKVSEHNHTLEPKAYIEILSECAQSFDVWMTVYHHIMPSVEAMLEWVKTSHLRPYLAALDDARKQELEAEILGRAKQVYEPLTTGEILFRFRRLFLVAKK